MHHLLRARKQVPARRYGGLRGDCRALSTEAVAELQWWVARLAERVGVPLASRRQFPAASMDGVVTVYADASRELSRLSESGFGGWNEPLAAAGMPGGVGCIPPLPPAPTDP